MAIEFQCPHCGKTLKTSDDRAGVEAKCPGCSELITIPSASETAIDSGEVSREDQTLEQGDSERRKPCPMCGEQVLVGASKCRFCGESLVVDSQGADLEPPPPEFGAIWESTWKIYQQNIGMAVAISLLSGMVQFGGSMLPGFILNIAQAAAEMEAGVYIFFYVACQLFSFAVQSYLSAGQAICFLKMARGNEVEIGDLFSGGPYFWPAVLGGFLYGIMVLLGTLALLIPGIFVMLYFWPFVLVIVDRNVGAFESLSKAKSLTQNYLGVSLLMGLCMIGLQLLGTAACCVGLIFTTPLAFLLVAVTYTAFDGEQSRRD